MLYDRPDIACFANKQQIDDIVAFSAGEWDLHNLLGKKFINMKDVMLSETHFMRL